MLPLLHKNIGVAVIWNDSKQILIDRRKASGLMGGMWEFPGGKLEAGETIEECIIREIKEELGIEIEVKEHLITIEYNYSEFLLTLNVYHAIHLSGEPQTFESQEIRWVTVDELDRYQFPAANIQIINALKEEKKEVGK